MKKMKYAIHTLLALLFLLVFAGGIPVKATAPANPITPPAQVAGVKQTGANTGSIDIEWTAQLAEDITYHIEMSEDGKSWVEKETRYGGNSAYVSGLNAGSTYYVRVRASVQPNGSDKVYGTYSAILECITAPNQPPEYLKKVTSTTNSITMEWGKIPGANLYEVAYYVKNTERDTAKILYTDKNTIVLKNLQQNQTYSVYVRGIRTTSNGSYRSESTFSTEKSEFSVKVTPTKVTGEEVKYYWDTSGEIVFSCDELASADGYEAEVWSNYKKKDTKLAVGTGTYDFSIRAQKNTFKKVNFLKGRIRAYSLNGDGKKIYGKWSNWIYFSQACKIKDVNEKNNKMQVVWTKVPGASRYTLYASTNRESGYKKVATTKKTNYLVTKVNKKSLKKGKTYYFYVKAEKKVGKKYHSSLDKAIYSITKYK